MRRRLFLAFVMTALLGPFYGVKAATPSPAAENMTVSPTQLPLELAPGGTTSGQITIINDGGTTYDFKAYAAPYHVAGETYDQSFQVIPGAPDVPSWIKLSSQRYHLEPHQSLSVPYTITIPWDTVGGGYYAALFYETEPKSGGGSGVQSKTRVGVVAYIRVKGAIAERGGVESFAAHFLQKGPPVTATLRLNNRGNVHYPARVALVATDMFGHRKAEVHVAREVLPGTIRRFDLSWDKAPAFGLFRLGGTVDLLGQTENLPIQYVLILAPAAFWGLLMAFVVVTAVAWWWWLGRRRR